jgi:hypothetical protein
VLPIKLLSFTAKIVNNSVVIEWITGEEENNDFFTIERSADGINYQPILHLPGAGNSISQLKYKAVDDQPVSKISYYRLRQTDYDGQFEYFAPVSVSFSIAEPITVYPNPASDYVSWRSDENISSVAIYSSAGTLVRLIETQNLVEQNTMEISDLQRGNYILRFNKVSGQETVRLIKN